MQTQGFGIPLGTFTAEWGWVGSCIHMDCTRRVGPQL